MFELNNHCISQKSPANIAGLAGYYIFAASISLRIVLNGRMAWPVAVRRLEVLTKSFFIGYTFGHIDDCGGEGEE